MSTYGTATMQRHNDGTVTVLHADTTIGVSQELLDSPHTESWVFPHGDQETIQLDTAGEYRYHRVGPSEDPCDLNVVIYERIKQVTT
jgi:hypothetical protein